MLPLNVPNALTLLRIVLVPLLVVVLLQDTPTGDVVAALIFALASVTDFADGFIARSRGVVTTFGKAMDPVADKLLVIAALVSLVSLDRLGWWVALVVIVRELAVTVARARAPEVIPAASLGKLKTGVQVLAILLLILLDPSPFWVDGVVLAMVAATIVSGADFFLALRRSAAATA